VTANIKDAGDAHKDQIVVAAKYGFALANRSTGELSYLCKAGDVFPEQDDPEKPHR
jgi:hypothetical protein